MLPPDYVMQEMAAQALETVTEKIAQLAIQQASDPRLEQVSGRDALLAFAAAIRSRNHQLYGNRGAAQ